MRLTTDFSDIKLTGFPLRTFARHGDVSAKLWQNRYVAWQNREKRQHEERQRLMEDRRRIFGGETDENDDDDICTKMLDFFNSLDYINVERCRDWDTDQSMVTHARAALPGALCGPTSGPLEPRSAMAGRRLRLKDHDRLC